MWGRSRPGPSGITRRAPTSPVRAVREP
jgi:hypothetical protein